MYPETKFTKQIQAILKILPHKPGVYQYFNESGTIIYVGKAKNLKKRVSSYFNKDNTLSGKVLMLVKNIANIKYIVVNSELDALLLENNLIKEHQPKYNINLKDDKTYPWICIKNEPFPRVFPTRNLIKDGSKYFGPYASGKMMHTLLELIRQLYQLRTCPLKLTHENISRKKFSVCLQYHIGNCKGPCVGLQTEDEYNTTISAIREIIKGNITAAANELKRMMMQYADNMEFEKAQIIKEKLMVLDNYQSKSTIVNPAISNIDVYSVVSDEKAGYANYMRVIEGRIVQAHTLEIRKKLDETDQQLLDYAIAEFRSRFESDAPEIVVPFEPETELPGFTITVPQRGDKKQLLELSVSNAKYFRLEKMKQAELVDPERRSKRVLNQMMKDLRMNVLPEHIECFDNSNIQGEYPVAAMVVFKNAKPEKKEYRHYNIQTVEGPNDFASMEEIITRRYKRLLEENKPLPQLIVVDGGKGQLSAALKSIDSLGLRGKITIIGIAKKLEEIYYPGDSLPMYLDKKSESLRVIQHIRDEAHRFGITHHRKRREKGTIKTQLTEIKGIGEATSNLLLTHFKSVKRIKEASIEELEAVVGKARAKAVMEGFRDMKM
jgi:excinuclease ABC subunit C